MRVVVIVFALLFSFPAFAQGKFFSTPSRGGAEGARQNAQLTTINSEFERMNACTGTGAVYAPTHPDANAGGCVTAIAERSMTGDLAVQGDAAISGQLDVAGTVRIAGEAEPCNGAKAGSLRYNTALEQMEFCNGSDWGSMGGVGSLAVVASGTVTVPGNSYSTAVTGLAAGSQYSAYVEPTYSTPGCGYILPTFGKGSDGKVAMTLWNNASCGGSVKWSVVRLGGSGTSSGGGGGGSGSGVPSGAVIAFNLSLCPSGWSPVTAAQGRFIVGTGTLGSDSYNLGATGGSARHTLTVAEMPEHDHGIGTYGLVSASGGGVYGLHHAYAAGSATKPAGGGQPHENRPPYLALLYCQKD